MDLLVYGVAGLFLLGFSAFVFRKKIKKPFGFKKEDPSSLFSLREALLKTRENFWERIKKSLPKDSIINDREIEKLEEILYTSDLGPRTVNHLINRIREKLEKKDSGKNQSDSKKTPDLSDQSSENKNNTSLEAIRLLLKTELNLLFNPSFPSRTNDESFLSKSDSLTMDQSKNQTLEVNRGQKPTVWMLVGVNGAGKTTSIGKLACQRVKSGERVLVAAGDTFRASADKQLESWSQRAGAEFFSPKNLKDPSALAFEAVKKAMSKNFDLVLVDTAGRLHTQKNLMEELKKTKRVMNKALEGSPHEILLVLDANSGQNALTQTEQFHKALKVTGIIVTKMDGSAKGGVLAGIAWEHGIPIKMIGVGEKIQDMRPFQAQEFVDSIL